MPTVFYTNTGQSVPAITGQQMREIDRVAIEDLGITLLQMMENAGRNLASHIIKCIDFNQTLQIAVLAGSGGNGGGGICCTRHLNNWGYSTNLIPCFNINKANGAVKTQLNILKNSNYNFGEVKNYDTALEKADIIIDAMIGYSLRGKPKGLIDELIEKILESKKRVISLDIPSGVNSSNGDTPGAHISAESTITLALPKIGLSHSTAGKIHLADIGIPNKAYRSIGLSPNPIFKNGSIIKIHEVFNSF